MLMKFNDCVVNTFVIFKKTFLKCNYKEFTVYYQFSKFKRDLLVVTKKTRQQLKYKF